MKPTTRPRPARPIEFGELAPQPDVALSASPSVNASENGRTVAVAEIASPAPGEFPASLREHFALLKTLWANPVMRGAFSRAKAAHEMILRRAGLHSRALQNPPVYKSTRADEARCQSEQARIALDLASQQIALLRG